MPNIGNHNGYNIYFWSNENGEPVHVHISKGKPTANSTKFWITISGGVLLAKNSSRVSKKDLEVVRKYIEANVENICMRWCTMFGGIKFYC